MVWFGQILLYFNYYHPVYIILGLKLQGEDKVSVNVLQGVCSGGEERLVGERLQCVGGGNQAESRQC